jgi:RIO-like serine/threonine protein kinase
MLKNVPWPYSDGYLSHTFDSFTLYSDHGYKLTYLGLDYLAIRVFVNRGVISGVGRRIGVGKESGMSEISPL